jgi:hypothetical protein
MSYDMAGAISTFLALWQERIDNYYAEKFPTLEPNQLEFKRGKKYYKVFSGHQGQVMVDGFIDIKTGDVLKAASWKATAKHARGNVLDDDHGMSAITKDGSVRYL